MSRPNNDEFRVKRVKKGTSRLKVGLLRIFGWRKLREPSIDGGKQIVFLVDFENDADDAKAKRMLSLFLGISDKKVILEESTLVVLGDVDPVEVATELKKGFRSQIYSVRDDRRKKVYFDPIPMEWNAKKRFEIHLDLCGTKGKKKAFEIVSKFAGVESVFFPNRSKRMIVIGCVDPVSVVKRFRKTCHTVLVSCGPEEDDDDEDDSEDGEGDDEDDSEYYTDAGEDNEEE